MPSRLFQQSNAIWIEDIDIVAILCPANDKTYLDLHVTFSIFFFFFDFNQMSKLTKICIVGAELVNADGQTERTARS
jgi:hypothetical protein